MSILAAYVVPHPPLILPEVGRGEEKKIQLTVNAYERAMKEAAEQKPDTVIIASPHTVMYADYFHIAPGEEAEGSFAQFGAEEITVAARYDTVLAKEIEMEAGEIGIEAGPVGGRNAALDHAVMIPLHFLHAHTRDFRVVRLGISGLSPLAHYNFGKCVARAVDTLGRRAVFIASGDLSHKLTPEGPYGFAPEGPRFDKACMKYLEEGDFLKLLRMDRALYEPAAECGLRTFWMMAGALDGQALKIKKLSYQGPFGVGYGVVSLRVTREDVRRSFAERYEMLERRAQEERRAAEDDYVRLARHAIETIVHTGKNAELPQGLPSEMSERAGVFVSLKKDGELRGCIGTFEPTTKNIAEEILQNAASAALRDPRFPPVKKEELDALVYSVDVLTEPELVAGADALDVKKYGVIVEYRARKGLLLPDLAGVDTVEEQLRIARQKGGIPADAPIRIWRFEVTRHT
ncbi:AmmeMemoRadiSam system protein A [uncultured Selenomonas sp.]|uniref:AmmeMemoRadiSam system protein A n=1 Tax=uncultured Selenomonas sp. TaxID=159275 RepID=UPI0028EF38C1|nr:AmmeMemoRadiSam system protein A [uncultured Selenomonas sp.]